MIHNKPSALVPGLWWLYGYTYDGLLNFYPYQNLLKIVASRVGSNPGKTLEIGCGTGNVLNSILNNYHGSASLDITGVDLSPSMIRAANKKLGARPDSSLVHLKCADILSFLKTQPSDSYDTIVSVNVLYAVQRRSEIWVELFRVIRPTGRMVMATADRTGSGAIIREHVQFGNVFSLLRPMLLGVFIVDSLINVFGDAGHFEFPSRDILYNEVLARGGLWSKEERCYGGSIKGVDVVFEVNISANK